MERQIWPGRQWSQSDLISTCQWSRAAGARIYENSAGAREGNLQDLKLLALPDYLSRGFELLTRRDLGCVDLQARAQTVNPYFHRILGYVDSVLWPWVGD